MHFLKAWVAVAAFTATFGASAQSTTTNEQRCKQLAADVNAEFQQAVQARVPKEDPATFNQNGFDIKSILMQDSSVGLAKLSAINFGNILSNLVQNGLQKAIQKGQQTFANKINGVLGEVGIKPQAFQTVINSASQQVGSTITNGANQAINSVSTPVFNVGSTPAQAQQPVTPSASPYGRR